MRSSLVVLLAAVVMASPLLAADATDTTPEVLEECAKFLTAIEACDKGPNGPLGALRKSCTQSAHAKYTCKLPVNEIKALLKKT